VEARHEHTVRALRHALAREREARERAASATVSMLDELLARLTSEIRVERHDRAHTESTLMKLLEEGVGRAREQAARHASMRPMAPEDEDAESEW
jgi:hypothetical protein